MQRQINLLFSSSTDSASNDVLPGVPVLDMFPNTDLDAIMEHDFYCSATVALAEELVGPTVMAELTRLNHFLVNMRQDFFGGVIQAEYIRNLQRELDLTPAELLSDKLRFLFFRESLHLSTRVSDWYQQNLGVPGPINFREEYEEKCYSNFLKVMQIPSPLDQFEIVPLIPMNIGNFYFSFTNPSLFMLLTLSFFLLLVLVFVLWILVRALWHFPAAVIHFMVHPSTIASSSSSSSSSNNKRRDKSKKKEDFITNFVVEEVEKYLASHKESLIKEFPGAFPCIETTAFLTKVSTDLLRGAGLPGTADPASMEILHMIHQNFVESFEIVQEVGYRNNIIYDSVRCFLKHYRSD